MSIPPTDRFTRSTSLRRPVLAVGAAVIISLGLFSDASAQMFGPRALGQTLRRSPSPGITTSGQPLRNRRFIRGNRTASDFVGTDRQESADFVGSEQAGAASRIRSAVAGGFEAGIPQAAINQPLNPASINRDYNSQVRVSFEYPRHFSPAMVADLHQRLERLPGKIEVSVVGRTATLRGVVPDESTKSLVETIVSFEPGISSIQNALIVDGDSPIEIPPPLPRP